MNSSFCLSSSSPQSSSSSSQNYILYKKIFNNIYLKNKIYSHLKEINYLNIKYNINYYLFNDPRKSYNEITFHWIVKYKKYQLLKDMIKSNYKTPLFKNEKKSEIILINDLELFLKYHNQDNQDKQDLYEFLNQFYKIHKLTLLEIQSIDLLELSILSNNLHFFKIIYYDNYYNHSDNNNNNNTLLRNDLIDLSFQNGVNLKLLEFLKNEIGLIKFNEITVLENIMLNGVNEKNRNNCLNFLIKQLNFKIDENDFYQIAKLTIKSFSIKKSIFKLLIKPITINSSSNNNQNYSKSLSFILNLISNYLDDDYSKLSTFSIKIIKNLFYLLKLKFNLNYSNNLKNKISGSGVDKKSNIFLYEKEIKKYFIFKFLFSNQLKSNFKEKDLITISFQFIIYYNEFNLLYKLFKLSSSNGNGNNSFLYKYGIRLACENNELFYYIYNNFRDKFIFNDKLVGEFIASRGNLELVQFIFNNQGLMKLIDSNLILDSAVCSNNLELVKYLIEKLNIQSISSSAYFQTLRFKNVEIFLYLLDSFSSDSLELNLNSILFNLDIAKTIKSRLELKIDKPTRYKFKGIPYSKNLNDLIIQLNLIIFKNQSYLLE